MTDRERAQRARLPSFAGRRVVPARRALPQATLRWIEVGLCLLLAAGCRGNRPPRPDTEEGSGTKPTPHAAVDGSGASTLRGGESRGGAPSTAPTRIELRNVALRVVPGATLHVRFLTGDAVAARREQPVTLDDKTSYVVHVREGQATVGYADLSRVMNEYTFAFDGAPVKDLSVSPEQDPDKAGQIQLKGRLRKALGVAFEIEGRPELTADRRMIRIRTTSIKALGGVKVGGLMHALGLEPKDVLGNLEQRGLRTDGDDMILDPTLALPPPRMSGRLASVRVGTEALTLTFGTRASGDSQAEDGRARPPGQSPELEPGAVAPGSGNYLWFRSGTIRIGRMTQRDADLRIVDQDLGDPLDFYSDRMTRQLVAGYAKLGATGGLTIFVPDYEDIR